MTCQAIVPTGDGNERVCGQPRAYSWGIRMVGELGAYVDLCDAHSELVALLADGDVRHDLYPRRP